MWRSSGCIKITLVVDKSNMIVLSVGLLAAVIMEWESFTGGLLAKSVESRSLRRYV